MRPEPLAFLGAETVQAVLERLQRDHPKVVLCGDWAAKLRLGTLAAYRLQLIVDCDDLDSLAAKHGATSPSEQPGHYRLQLEGVEVSLIVAGQAYLGERLRLPAAALAEQVEVHEGLRTLSPEGVFASRMASLLDRPDTRTAERDRGELLVLAAHSGGLDWGRLASILRETEHPAAVQQQLLRETFGRLAELEGLGRHGPNRIWGWQHEALEAVDQAAASAAAEARLQELTDKRREGTLTREERRQERVLYYRQVRQQQPQLPPDHLDPPLRSPDLEPER